MLTCLIIGIFQHLFLNFFKRAESVQYASLLTPPHHRTSLIRWIIGENYSLPIQNTIGQYIAYYIPNTKIRYSLEMPYMPNVKYSLVKYGWFLCSGSLHRHRKVWLRLSRTPWFVCFFLCLMPSHPFSLPPTFFFKPMTPFYSLLHLASDCSLSVHRLPIAGVHGDGGRGDRGLEHDTVFGWKPVYLYGSVSLVFFHFVCKGFSRRLLLRASPQHLQPSQPLLHSGLKPKSFQKMNLTFL